MLNVLAINVFKEGDLKVLNDVRVDVKAVVDAKQDATCNL